MGPKMVCCFSVRALAAPDRNVAANSLMSARLSDLMTSPRRPALPSVMAQPDWLVFVVKLAVKGDGLDLHFHPVLPDERPTVAAGDAFALMVGLGRPMNLRARRDNQLAAIINVLGDEADDGGLDGRRIHRDDRFAGNQPSERGKHRAQLFGRRNSRRTVGKQTDGRERWRLVRGHHWQRRGFRKMQTAAMTTTSLAATWMAADNKPALAA